MNKTAPATKSAKAITKAAAPKKAAGLNLSAFGAPAPSKGKTEYPVLSDPACAAVVDQLAAELDQLKALEGSVEILKGTLRQTAYPFWVEQMKGSVEFTESVVIPGTDSAEAMVAFTKGYRTGVNADEAKETAMRDLLGDQFDALFAPKTIFTINVDAIAEEKQQAFIDGLVTLCAKVGVDAGKVVKAKQALLPVDNFNQVRVRSLSLETNVAIDEVYKTPTMVKIR